MPAILYGPVPHKEASDFISDKPVVSRTVFDQMVPEVRARTFMVTGMVPLDIAQRLRDRIADLPTGADWNDIKGDLADSLSPFLAQKKEDGTIDTGPAERRAELLLRTHGYQAYSAAQYEVLQRQKDVFPNWRYQTAQDDRVRDSHAALEGVVVPANDPFWDTHFPPWDFNCRCTVVPLNDADLAEIKTEDDKKPADERSILSDQTIARMNTDGALVRGPNQIVDVRSPRQKRDGDGYAWQPGDLRIPVATLKERYSPEVWSAFEAYAKRTAVDGRRSVWEWLNGSHLALSPIVPTAPAAPTLAGSLEKLGLASRVDWTAQEVEKLVDELKEEQPHQADALIASVVTPRKTGPFAEGALRSSIQAMLDLVPTELAQTLPKISIVVSDYLPGGSLGLYYPQTHRLSLAMRGYESGIGNRPHETLWHELMHWLHMSAPGPAADVYRDTIRQHYMDRTANDTPIAFGDGFLRRDKWWRPYAGREYPFEHGRPAGIEVPTSYFQLLANPEKLAGILADPAQDAHAIVETMKTVLGILYPAAK